MKPSSVLLVPILGFGLLNVLHAQPHEGYPVLNASELLKPEVLRGPHHLVLESVPTQGFANQYTIQTRWGIFTVRGNDLLAKRIQEFDAITRLENASKSDEFKRSLAAAAAKPLYMVGGTLQDPVGTVKKLGSGAARFLNRAGEAIERGGRKSAHTEGAVKSVLGFAKVKREIAHELKVDPYTDNQVLQQRLDDMARASYAGGFAIRAGTFALSAGADVGIATAAGYASSAATVTNAIRDNSPLDLSKVNRNALTGLGVSEAGANAFVEHPKVSPTQQTLITSHLSRLGPVAGIEDFLRMILPSQDAADVQFFVRTAEMMAVYHEKVSPVKRVLNLFGLPAIHAGNNALVVPLAVDYGSWSPEADRLAQALASYQPQVEISLRLLYVSGRLSPRARQELRARGFEIAEGANSPLYQPEPTP